MKDCPRTIGPFKCCTIILGKCERHLAQIPPASIDLVVTDPPYGMNLKPWRNHRRVPGDDRFPVEIIKQIIEIPRLGSYFFCRWDNLWDHGMLPKPKSVLVWEKLESGGAGDTKHEHSRDYELALFYPGPKHKFKGRPGDVLQASREGNDVHPTTKPVRLIREMLEWYDFETVLDPFMGSGSTGQAAKALGKHFLGFEMDEEYHKMAVHFVGRELAQKPAPSQNIQIPLGIY